ncbi:helix-turn-helix domain-containing protein [Actinoallomurus sp. CA-150999]|uniref:helix-turn-helix domain-containing protein n=1 Tax=Actinoallomurus sp. CA-150999 TaxID=3239887 RepID=UPI003D8A6421
MRRLGDLPYDGVRLLSRLHRRRESRSLDRRPAARRRGGREQGRTMFGMLSVLAELQRELVVASTNDGLAAARARRRPKLTQRQLDQAQKMYDDGTHTVEEIAQTFHVPRPTLYRRLTAHHEGRDCALIVHRGKCPGNPRPHTCGKLREFLLL